MGLFSNRKEKKQKELLESRNNFFKSYTSYPEKDIVDSIKNNLANNDFSNVDYTLNINGLKIPVIFYRKFFENEFVKYLFVFVAEFPSLSESDTKIFTKKLSQLIDTEDDPEWLTTRKILRDQTIVFILFEQTYYTEWMLNYCIKNNFLPFLEAPAHMIVEKSTNGIYLNDLMEMEDLFKEHQDIFFKSTGLNC